MTTSLCSSRCHHSRSPAPRYPFVVRSPGEVVSVLLFSFWGSVSLGVPPVWEGRYASLEGGRGPTGFPRRPQPAQLPCPSAGRAPNPWQLPLPWAYARAVEPAVRLVCDTLARLISPPFFGPSSGRPSSRNQGVSREVGVKVGVRGEVGVAGPGRHAGAHVPARVAGCHWRRLLKEGVP